VSGQTKTSTPVPRIGSSASSWSDTRARTPQRFIYGDERIAPACMRMADDETAAHREWYIAIGLIKPDPTARTIVGSNGDHYATTREVRYGAGRADDHVPWAEVRAFWDAADATAPLDRHVEHNKPFLAVANIPPGRSVLARPL
jgi:hypothetical protein